MSQTRFSMPMRTVLTVAVLALSAFGMVSGQMPGVPTGQWTAGQSLASEREGAVATLLQNGGVLITGGVTPGGATASADLLGDAGTFSAVAPMSTARAHHSATLLDDGRVLAVGGTTSDGATAAAEAYAAGTWTDAGSLADARHHHTATLLLDGRVLIAGGENALGPVGTLELFDPRTNTFAPAGTMASARTGHAAARLGDGRVVIVGGFDGQSAIASLEVFDPSDGSIVLLGNLTTPRAGLTATALLDGRVLFFGGNDGTTNLASGEIYDPASGALTPAAAGAVPRRDHQAILLPNNNGVLIVGGIGAGGALASAELFLPWTNGFRPTGSPAAPRAFAAATALGTESYGLDPGPAGLVLTAGGQGQSSSELYGFATIRTDKDDYAPGMTVYVSGAGWQPNEQVTFGIRELPAEHDVRTLTIAADDAGRITNAPLFIVEQHHIGVRFFLTARGAASAAQVAFTDGVLEASVTTPTTDTPATVTALPGNVNVAFHYRTNGNGGTFAATVRVLSSGDGVVASNSTSLSRANGGGGANESLAVTIPAGTPAGAYTIELVISNPGGTGNPSSTSDTESDAIIVSLANAPPAIASNSDTVAVNEGDTASNTGTWSDANTADTVTLTASVGTVVKSGANAAGTWSWSLLTTDGPTQSQTVTITANDGNGGQATTSFELVVNNAAPVANAGADATIDEGSTFTANGSFTDPGADTWTATVDYGDGGGPQALALEPDKTFALSHVYQDNGTYTVTVTVADEDGGSHSDTLSVTVDNVAPAVNAGADVTVDEGSSFTRTGSFTDPGTLDTWTATVNYGDGSGVQTLALNADQTFALGHTYADNGTYTVTVTVTDDDGGPGTDTLTVIVNNVKPAVTAGANATIDEGSLVSRTGSFTDPGADTWTATVDYGDGSGAQLLALNPDKTFALSHSYADDGSFTVIVKVADDDGGEGTAAFTVTVNNVAPTIALTGATSSLEGASFTLNLGAVTDPGTDTVTSYVINWGDGTTETVGGSPVGAIRTHNYADGPAAYSIVVDLVDEDGTHPAAGGHAVTVVNVAPTIAVIGAATVAEGSTYLLSLGAVVDPGVDTVTSYTITWGDGTSDTFSGSPAGLTKSHVYVEGPATPTIVVELTDEDGTHQNAGGTAVSVLNVAPTLYSLTPSVFTAPIGTAITLSAQYTDPGTSDTHTCHVNWDDGEGETETPGTSSPGSGSCSGIQTFLQQGVYSVSLYVKDDDGDASNTLTVMITIYDPDGGFVTGGGWILSPEGAYTLDPSATGKAHFGFVSKYRRGSHVPEGQTEFQFKAGNLNFHSSAYDVGSLVVAGHKAQYKGVGTINGVAGFRFVLTAYDGQAQGGGGIDRFRMKIVRIVDDVTVYDNSIGASDDIDLATPSAIGGGSIVIHQPRR